VLGTTAARGILALAPRDVSSERQSLIDPNRAVTVNSIQIPHSRCTYVVFPAEKYLAVATDVARRANC
jgi:hypothetical protein